MGQWHQMHLAALPKVAKTTKKQRRGTLSLFVPSAICGLIDVDALDPAFSTDGFDGSGRISWQWIKCNLARLARRPLTDHQVVPLDPFLSIHPMLAIIFNAEKTIQLGGLTFPARSLDLSECCSNIFLTFDAWDLEGLGEVPAEIKFADKFSQVFSASRVLG